jgi:acyl-CoA thioesterase-1
MVFGDSQGWVSLLAGRLREAGVDYKVANASISGETTLGGRNRLAASLQRERPAIVVLALGANDGLRGGDLGAMRANLEAMIDAARKAGARVLLVGMQLPPNYGAAYTEKFQKTFTEVAASRKVPLVPFLMAGFASKMDYFQADGIHPAASAQPLMLETVWQRLRPLLDRR